VPGRFVGPDGCSHEARGVAAASPGFTTSQDRRWVRSLPKGSMASASPRRSVAGTYPVAGKVGSELPRMYAPRALARACWIAAWMALGMVDGLSVSSRRFWRPARQRRGRCAIAQPGAAKFVALRRLAFAAGCVLGKADDRPTARDAPDKRRAASATACRRLASMGVDKARSATSVPCAGRSGAACSAVLRGAKPARRGGRQPTPGGKRSAQASADRREGTLEAR
jgi:hypothetical protein